MMKYILYSSSLKRLKCLERLWLFVYNARCFLTVSICLSYSCIFISPCCVMQVVSFCADGEADGGTISHNRSPPNKQNRFCDGGSAWEIMSSLDDFSK